MRSIYRNPLGKEKILLMYDKLQSQIDTKFESRYVDTRFGTTHLLVGGNEKGPPLICFHGGNVVNPITLKWFEPLSDIYRIYAPDTIGHPGKSDEIRLNPKTNQYAEWVCDFMDALNLQKANFIGPSYGGGILIRLAAYAPERIEKAVFLVPSGIAGGKMMGMMRKILVPLAVYKAIPSDRNLYKACSAMFDEEIHADLLLQIKYIYDDVRLETVFPKYATQEELMAFTAPSLLIAADQDVFFPAAQVVPRSKEIFNHLQKIVVLENSSHFQNSRNLETIIEEIRKFL